MSLPFCTYILKCSDGSYYTGQTDDLEKRMEQHQSGRGSGYTGSRLPVALVWYDEFPTREEAREAERKIKGWTRAKKEALIEGNWKLISRLSGRSKESRTLREKIRYPSRRPFDKLRGSSG